MHKLFSSITLRHNVKVTTGDRHNAGTSANVYMIMYDEKGAKSPILKFDRILRNDLERATTDCYKGPKVDDDFGLLAEIEIWRDKCGPFDDWYCDVIKIHDSKTGEEYPFPVQRWVKADVHYKIHMRHTTLPQDEHYPEMRENDLISKRETYQYMQKLPGLPVQVKKLPPDEDFSRDYTFDLAAVAVASFGKSAILKTTTCLKSRMSVFLVKAKWMTTDDIKQLYNFDLFPRPRSVDYYKDDVWFAARKLAGVNPTEIELCRKVPDKFAVKEEMVSEFLEGRTLAQAAKDNRLFIIDHKICDGLPVKNPETTEFPSPMALFYLDSYKTLRPIAIQLQQKPGPENPVFLPSDPPNLWMLAKMWFHVCDSMIHQSLQHLGFTHLIMEGICINMHRNIAMNHPVFRLMAPHFLYLLAINVQAVEKLLAPDGFVQKTMQCGVKGMLELISRKFKCFRFDVDGCLPEQVKARGLDSVDVLPVYPYRDDGLLLYNAIRDYVARILNHYYSSPDKLINDKEIQAWGRELVAPAPEGLALQGIPSNGNFQRVDDLCMMVTTIIFICSVQHAAVNFLQYEEYAFPPSYPATLNAKLPKNKRDIPTDQDLVNLVADKKTTVDTMIVTKILSQKATKSLGDWEEAYQYDNVALHSEREFRAELLRITEKIAERNKTRNDLLKYDVLDPKNIPNAISI